LTELTEQQREAIDQARRLLAPHFPGETLRLYCPRQAVEYRERLHRQVAELLAANVAQREISRRVGISVGTVASINGRIRRGMFSFPP
jgi:DNA invertase Pin-like site-specific DNA recombinase